MRLPAKTNVGIARRTQLCEPATRLDGSFWREKLPRTSPRKPETPRAKTIGIESATSTAKRSATAAKNTAQTSSATPSPGARPRQAFRSATRSEEHTSELQSRLHLVCRLLLEKKKKKHISHLVAGTV